jgi:Ca2+-binding RTX toxin-like protein
VATIDGTGGDDLLRGTAGGDTIDGLGGRDLILGLGGNDQLLGGDGGDRLDGGTGSDLLLGGAGADVLLGRLGNDQLLGEEGRDLLVGGPGDDVLDGGPGRDRLLGGDGDDILSPGEGGGLAAGGAGRDTLDYGFDVQGPVRVDLAAGRAVHTFTHGVDTLHGIEDVTGTGYDDAIAGDAHGNVIAGGLGADRLTGGAGADTFAYLGPDDSPPGAADLITDFAQGSDRIDLSGFRPAFGWAFVGEAERLTGPGEVAYHFERGLTVVEITTHSAHTADLEIDLHGRIGLTATDFIL